MNEDQKTMSELKKLREMIDRIDQQILTLLNQRTEIALHIGEIKNRKAQTYYAPERESVIYRHLSQQNKGPLPAKAVRAVYREIMSATLALQHPLKIAYLGPKATFTHLAAREKFGDSADYIPVRSISDVFTEVEKERADHGVVPIENSTEGVVNHTLDMFIDSDLKISAEVSLRITHNLLVKKTGVKIKKIYSHSQPFAQCRLWLESNLPRVKLEEVSSTAEAAKLAAREKETAAIASKLAAELYGLSVVSQGIEDSGENYTRFLVIGREFNQSSGRDKTSIMFSIKDSVGALCTMLEPFKKYNINLTKIESRPSRRRAWDYFFFIDMEGHAGDENVKKAIDELEKYCIYLKILGSYPIGENKQ